MVELVRCVPVSVLFSDLLKSWGRSVTGTYIVRLGHCRVYGYVDIGACARYCSCLCHSYAYSTFGGNMGLI